MSIPSVSFSAQDVGWYIQQQSWTQSFYQADQNWTAKVSSNTEPAAAGRNLIGRLREPADAKIVTLVNSPSASELGPGALQASQARSGTLIDLVT